MIRGLPEFSKDPWRQRMRASYLAADDELLKALLSEADIGEKARRWAFDYAFQLVKRLRAQQQARGGIDALLNEYALSTEEGIALMCLAEALLRVPDDDTADRLIRDKLQGGDWSAHLGQSHSSFVNASAWALMLTGKMVNYSDAQQRDLHNALKRTSGRLGLPVIRSATRRAMAIMGDVYVLGRTIDSALQRARTQEARGYRYSYDMLGEGARTAQAAQHYFDEYAAAIRAIGGAHPQASPAQSAGISVKLSALHPRFELAQHVRVRDELQARLMALCVLAREHNIGLTVDAEEAARLDLSLELIEAVMRDTRLRGWSGLGLAVQAYQKRAPLVIEWLLQLAQSTGRPLNVRLVKGAYWDSEIKHAQQLGLADYPVYTRKAATDVSYQACARKLLAARPHLYPQFATHNAWTVAAILAMDEQRTGYEFQRLHGMGDALYAAVMQDHGVACRIYAPVGEHADLLAYLVRRLLENGANSSFVNNIVDAHVSIEALIQDPVLSVRQWQEARNPAIPLPVDMLEPHRRNAAGLDLQDLSQLEALQGIEFDPPQPWQEGGFVVRNPARLEDELACLAMDGPEQMLSKLAQCEAALQQEWPAAQRAQFLQVLARALEAAMPELMGLCQREAGKTLADARDEVREAVDFCRYYAGAIHHLPPGQPLGVVLCISPWNFPLAIFLGQITAALAAGNAVLAKPAEQTSLIALKALQIMQDCGLPPGRVIGILAQGVEAGQTLVPQAAIQGVMFTGSNTTARWLFDALSQRSDGPVPLLAETGGQNAMIVDSSALPEQVVDDVIQSGFLSAGQRCSALRVLFLQEEVADRILHMIVGGMRELRMGDPAELATDIGPLIDSAARQRLQAHAERMAADPRAKLICSLDAVDSSAWFFPPQLYQIESLEVLQGEVFGPVVHVLRYRASERAGVVESINRCGFGLTLGVQTRVQTTADEIAHAAQVGNIYVNRDMVGAVVGVQPFGGRGLSGTGPKAGGPLYVPCLQRPLADPDAAAQLPSRDAHALPGPTGERNVYQLQPWGRVLAYYADTDDLRHAQLSLYAVLAGGNQLWMQIPQAWAERLGASAEQALQRFGLPADHVHFSHGEAGLEWPVVDQLCLLAPPGSAVWPGLLKQLRGQERPLPRLVCRQPGAGYAECFMREKVVTTNTTAAGGNASLMTLKP